MKRKSKREKELDTILMDFYAVGMSLMRGNAGFRYTPLASAMKFGHPGDILIEELDNILFRTRDKSPDAMMDFREFIEGMIEEFAIFELEEPLEKLRRFLEEDPKDTENARK